MDIGVEFIYMTYDWAFALRLVEYYDRYEIEYKKNGGVWEYITWFDKKCSTKNK